MRVVIENLNIAPPELEPSKMLTQQLLNENSGSIGGSAQDEDLYSEDFEGESPSDADGNSNDDDEDYETEEESSETVAAGQVRAGKLITRMATRAQSAPKRALLTGPHERKFLCSDQPKACRKEQTRYAVFILTGPHYHGVNFVFYVILPPLGLPHS